jgi:hypothetical protein
MSSFLAILRYIPLDELSYVLIYKHLIKKGYESEPATFVNAQLSIIPSG